VKALDDRLLGSTALDQRIACVGTTGSGKTYALKGLVERLLALGHRACIIDPLGVWWGLRAAADGGAGPFDLRVFGGRHADVPLNEHQGAALGRLVATRDLSCVVDLSELGSKAARRRFMQDFLAALYEANSEPLTLVLDEADLFAPQRPQPDGMALYGLVDEIVRRGRVRGFIPWLITQRPAVLAKDVLSQADILLALKLTSAQDRNAIGAWIEGQADRAQEKAVLAALPGLQRGEAFLWAPGLELLERVAVPPILTFDSSRTPKRGERVPLPALTPVDVAGLAEALQAPAPERKAKNARPLPAPATQQPMPDAAAIEQLCEKARDTGYTEGYAAGYPNGYRQASEDFAGRMRAEVENTLIAAVRRATADPLPDGAPARAAAMPTASAPQRRAPKPERVAVAGDELHPAARKLMVALARHSPKAATWAEAAVLAGMSSSGGHFMAGRRQLLDSGLVEEREGGKVAASDTAILRCRGAVVLDAPSRADLVTLWCGRLKAPAPEILQVLAANAGQLIAPETLAERIGKSPTGGHWMHGLSQLRDNGLAERIDGLYRLSPILQQARTVP